VNYFIAIIKQANPPKTTMTIALADSLLSSYFKNPLKVSECQGIQTIFCENFQTIEAGKKGYGVYVASEDNQSITLVFSCFVPKESSKYANAKSCLGLY